MGVKKLTVAKLCDKRARSSVHSFGHDPTMHRNIHVHVYSRHSYMSFQRDTLYPLPFKQQVRIKIGPGVSAIPNVTTNEQQAEAAQLVTK